MPDNVNREVVHAAATKLQDATQSLKSAAGILPPDGGGKITSEDIRNIEAMTEQVKEIRSKIA